jgi:hypothetical protein
MIRIAGACDKQQIKQITCEFLLKFYNVLRLHHLRQNLIEIMSLIQAVFS